MNDTSADTLARMGIDELCINTIRTLAMDAVQQANSGHPGTPMALAPLAYVLWTRCMRYNPRNPHWFNRDRFVLSAGHASMLLYAMLHLTGYDLSLEEIKRFRQWGSKTPGHIERALEHGVETTTGPLGQGIMNSVGMAIAESHLAAIYNRAGHEIVDHYTYAICSDGDMMEGASHEAASIAGHLKLGKLIWIYDSNHISIEGDTTLAYSDDVTTRFEAYHWHVQNLGDHANDLERIASSIRAAQHETKRPSLIIVRSHIAYGAPHLHDTAKAHGTPLGEEEVRQTKQFYGWPADAQFLVPERAGIHMRQAIDRGMRMEQAWNERLAAYQVAYPALGSQLEAALRGDLPDGWDAQLPYFQPAEGPIATRSASEKILNSIARNVPWLIGGSADLAPSTNTLIKDGGDFERDQYAHRNLHWGVREHVMCAASSGMALHGGVRPYAATFLIFTDYARPSIRLAAMMGLPVIYVMTHDSIGLGEDGPTHQPIEHLASLRALPNLCVIRPADANETAYAWRVAMNRKSGPTLLALTRQALPILDREKITRADGVQRGAYILSRELGATPDIILIATGSEVHLALQAQSELAAQHRINARVVSMPSWELFREQPQDYRNDVLPPTVRIRLAIEAGSPQGWCEWVGDHGGVVGLDHFGASAPAKENFSHFGFAVENLIDQTRKLLGR